MKEIKFRGKRIDNKQWVYGYVQKTPKNEIAWICNEVSKFGEFEVIYETICQFTGLKDSNGEEIYENDILDFDKNLYPEDTPCPYIVIFGDGSYRRRFKTWEKNLPEPRVDKADISILNDKIIGNKFDNPEILGT